ncbi:MAG TPA: GAF domain-containing protein [Flavobacteriales bacterium]|nr:GAF domain-containing protein [Flavobacteriales bacterium]
MSHTPIATHTDRVSAYAALGPQLRGLLKDERDLIAAMANFSALLKEAFGWHWVGFYRVVGAELVLGPFQGPVACVRIGYGKGVCGMAWQEERTLAVPDVDKFPGHIACSPHSRSEIVVPCRGRDGRIAAVLDIDSSSLDDFGTVDIHALETLCEQLQPLFE